MVLGTTSPKDTDTAENTPTSSPTVESSPVVSAAPDDSSDKVSPESATPQAEAPDIEYQLILKEKFMMSSRIITASSLL